MTQTPPAHLHIVPPATSRPPVEAVHSTALMHQHADEMIAVLKAMANHNRLLLLCQLTQGERSVGDLAVKLGLSQSVVSQHLALLRREGVVSGRRDAQSIYYSISDTRVQSLMNSMSGLFCAAD